MNEDQPCRTSADVAGYCLTHAQRLAFCLVDKDLTISSLRQMEAEFNDLAALVDEREPLSVQEERRAWRAGGC